MEYTFEKGLGALGLLIGAALAGFGLVALYNVATSDGKVDYCYVNYVSGTTGGYEVVGHRAWRSDAHLGVSGSPEGANELLRNSALCQR